jgi:Paraquat-inducible protein A
MQVILALTFRLLSRCVCYDCHARSFSRYHQEVRPASASCVRVDYALFHSQAYISPEKPFLPSDLYQIDLLVAPLWGLYANMIAQLVSQISSHFIIHYHRLVANAANRRVEAKQRFSEVGGTGDCAQEQPTDIDELFTGASDDASTDLRLSIDSEGSEKRTLCNHEFTRPHRGETSKLQARSWVSLAFVFLCVTTVTLLLVGCILPSYSFDYLGLVGVAVESGMDFEEARVYLGVISTAQLLMDQARFLGTAKDTIGLLSISIVLVLTSMIVPIAQVFTLLVEWLVPVRRVAANRLRVAMEVLQAWQYVEVFLLSVIVAVWQIGDVSTFLVNDYCGGLSGTFSALVSSGILDPADAQCFRSQASIEPASYVLIAAAIVLIMLTNFVTKATAQRLREDTELGLQRRASTTMMSLGNGDDNNSNSNSDDLPPIEKLANIPVLFTDQYRWLLVSSKE